MQHLCIPLPVEDGAQGKLLHVRGAFIVHAFRGAVLINGETAVADLSVVLLSCLPKIGVTDGHI